MNGTSRIGSPKIMRVGVFVLDDCSHHDRDEQDAELAFASLNRIELL